MQVEAALESPYTAAQIVCFDIPAPTDKLLASNHNYQINMCLTPRPLYARAGYVQHWGPHRFERLGDIFLIPPHEQLQMRGDGGKQASLTLQFSADLVQTQLGQKLEWSAATLASTLDITSARIRQTLYRITEEVRHPGLAARQMLDLLASELVIELGRYCTEMHERPVTGGLASWRLRLIDERLAEDSAPPTLAELAELCSLSIRQLTRGFRISRNASIGEYIESRRMEAAKRLLMTGDSVKTVAFACGFSSASGFTFAFRRAIGISPNQFRQRQLRVVTSNGA